MPQALPDVSPSRGPYVRGDCITVGAGKGDPSAALTSISSDSQTGGLRCGLIVVLPTATAYGAPGARFLKARANIDTSGSLVVDFKLAGLSSIQVQVTVSTPVDGYYADGSRIGPGVVVSAFGTYTVSKNGQVTAERVLFAPPSPSGSPVASVTWGPVSISELPDGLTIDLGTYSATF